jgi:PhzF family phenazine biosynthesis protein
MSVLRYVRLDVFTNQPFTGIQLAVFPDAAGIDERRMQRTANEMALPETTFVFPPEAPKTDSRVRIFTPSRELPMAGSPTIGTRRETIQLCSLIGRRLLKRLVSEKHHFPFTLRMLRTTLTVCRAQSMSCHLRPNIHPGAYQS